MDSNSTKFIHTEIQKYIITENFDALEILISENISIVNKPFANGSTVIHTAIRQSKLNYLKLLIKYNANLDVCDFFGDTPILHLVKRFDDDNKYTCEMLIELLRNGANVNKTDMLKIPPLLNAAFCRKFEFVKLLIKYHANLNYQDDKGNTILHTLIIYFHEKMRLIDDSIDDGALDYPASNYYIDDNYERIQKKSENIIFSYLLDTCIAPEIKNNEGKTVLELAIGLLRFTKINILLNYGVKFDYRNTIVRYYLLNLIGMNKTKLLAFSLYHLVKRWGAKNFRFYSDIPNSYKLFPYILELEAMKHNSVRGIRYFDILLMNLDKFAHLMNEGNNCPEFFYRTKFTDEKFPLFTDFIKKRIYKAETRLFYIDYVWVDIFRYIKPSTMYLPKIIVPIITGLLNNSEIMSFRFI